eukprot:5326612-Amphidinium_carterae.1
MGHSPLNACTDSLGWQDWSLLNHNSWNFQRYVPGGLNSTGGFSQFAGPAVHLDQVSPSALSPLLLDGHDFCFNQLFMHFAGISSFSTSPTREGVHPQRLRECQGEEQIAGIARGDGSKKRRARAKTQDLKTTLKFATINVRSLLCDKSPGLAETARSTIFRKEMNAADHGIICVQESKLREEYVKDCDLYQVTAASPVDKVGGLQILVSKQKGCRINWSRTISYRVLVAGVTWMGESWCIINAYAPTNAAPREEFELFCEQLKEALILVRRNGLPLLVGTDLNTRLGGERDDVHISPAVVGCQPAEKKYRAEELATILATFSMAALTTMVGEPHTTWVSPHESASQIDYVLGQCARLDRVVSTQVQELACFASDHSIVICELATNTSRARPSTRIRPMPAPIRSPDHALAVKLALAGSDHSNWQNHEDPLQGMVECLNLAKEVVTQAPGSKAVVKREWITASSWSEIRHGATIRRKLNRSWKQLGQARLRAAWQALRTYEKAPHDRIEDIARATLQQYRASSVHIAGQMVESFEQPGWIAELEARNMRVVVRLCALVWALYRVASRRQAKVVQKAVRADKLMWMQEQTDELAAQMFEGNSSSIHKQVKKCLLQLRPNVAATRRAPLKDSTGKLHVTDDEKRLAWQSHWASLYGGRVMSQTRTFQECRMDTTTSFDPRSIREDDWFTQAEVKSALRHQMNGKASIDGVPSKELVVLLDRMTPVWTRAFNSFVKAGSIPHEYRGT